MAINDNNFGVNSKTKEWEYLGPKHDEAKEEKRALKPHEVLAKHAAKKNKFGKMVKVMGHEVREGTKQHTRLVSDKKHYDDLASSER